MFQSTVVGRIGQVTPHQGQGGQFLRIRLAVPLRQRNSQARTEWVTVFTTRTELAPYLTQGRQILVSGHTSVDVYNNQVSITLHAFHVELLAESVRGQIANLLPQLLGTQAQPAMAQAPAQPVMPVQPTMAQAQSQTPAPTMDPNILAQALAAVLGGNRAQPTGVQSDNAQPQAQPTMAQAQSQANDAAPTDAIPEAAPF